MFSLIISVFNLKLIPSTYLSFIVVLADLLLQKIIPQLYQNYNTTNDKCILEKQF